MKKGIHPENYRTVLFYDSNAKQGFLIRSCAKTNNIAYQDEKDPANIRNYRVDRMSYVKVLDRPRRGKEAFAAFDLPLSLIHI